MRILQLTALLFSLFALNLYSTNVIETDDRVTVDLGFSEDSKRLRGILENGELAQSGDGAVIISCETWKQEHGPSDTCSIEIDKTKIRNIEYGPSKRYVLKGDRGDQFKSGLTAKWLKPYTGPYVPFARSLYSTGDNQFSISCGEVPEDENWIYGRYCIPGAEDLDPLGRCIRKFEPGCYIQIKSY